jgi:hypothetical protein
MEMLRYAAALIILFLGCAHDNSSSPGPLFPPPTDSRPIGLSTPKLSVAVGIESGDCSLSWSEIPKATSYTLESDRFENFLTASVTYAGPAIGYYLGYASDHSFTSFYRVRAENHDSISSWSNLISFP